MLNRAKPPGELAVGRAERRLGVDPQLSSEVGDRKQEIADLFFDVGGVGRFHGLTQLRHLFIDLVDDGGRLVPVEADVGGAGADARRAQQRWQRLRDAVEQRLPLGGRAAFARLDPLPLFLDLGRRQIATAALGGAAAEDVRVPSDQLGDDGVGRVGDGEGTVLGADLGDEHRFEQQVAELVTQRAGVAAVDRIDDLVGFLQDERPERGQRLLSVPRAAVG